MSAPSIVTIEGLRVERQRRPILDGIDLTIAPGERVAVLGRNGAGKSTLVDTVLGLLAPTAGRVLVLGEPPPSRHVGFVPQHPATSLMPWMDVEGNVELPLRARGAGAEERAAMLDRVRALVDPDGSIGPRARPQAISGGERQLVALMRGLVGAPRLLVCDEPFSAVDAPSRVRLRAAFDRACSGPGAPALLLVTHDPEDVLALATRAVVLGGHPARIVETIDVRAGACAATLARAMETAA